MGNDVTDITEQLHNEAMAIASAGHCGWGNLMSMAAEEIEACRASNEIRGANVETLTARVAELESEITNIRIGMRLNEVSIDFAHSLAVMLQCALLNPTATWDDAHSLLQRYHEACEKASPSPPTLMGEPVIDDVYTAQVIEIDGHEYGLRPGAARIVREALKDAERYRNALAWIATVAATEREYQDIAISILGEPELMKLIPWRNAYIDAAMAKDGAR